MAGLFLSAGRPLHARVPYGPLDRLLDRAYLRRRVRRTTQTAFSRVQESLEKKNR